MSNEQSTIELKPCPFCGASAWVNSGPDWPGFGITCGGKSCAITPFTINRDTLEEAAKDWNQRTQATIYVKPCPDSAGFWWYQSAHRPGWEMVEAREIYPGHICLYSCQREWGGHTLELAREYLPGKWVKVNQPGEQPSEAERLEAAFREGYVAGYNMGGSDVSAFECGSGSKHDNIRDRDQQDAWEQSDTYAAIHADTEDAK